MGSFALWFEQSGHVTDGFRADVHFNLWDLHGRKAQPPCLDVGIKIFSPQRYSKIFFYVPWKISKGDLCDLGQHLKTTEILCTVFNEDYTVAQDAQSKVLHIEDAAKVLLFNIYCLDIENDVDLQYRYNGTLLSISRPKQFEGSSITEYYRFRIQNNCFTEMIKCYSPQNIFLQSAVSITEAIDFRFNDYRSLPSSLIEAMRTGKSYEIGKVHFLLITESDVDLLYSSISPTARELEKGTWKMYYDKLSKENIVAYHWKFKSETKDKLIENCIMFVKTRVHRCNWKTILIYIIVAGGLAVLFNYISNLLF